MGVLDKIKNALFEVEYVEVDEEETKSKKEDRIKERKEEKEKPIAKKIVLPGKRQDRYQDLHDEELVDEDFEIEPKKDNEVHEEFKFMDDNDFKMDDDIISNNSTPEVIETPNVQTTAEVKNEVPSTNEVYKDNYSSTMNTSTAYQNANNSNKETKAYGISSSYNVPVHEYGTYDRREERTYFKPSPIISPIYGILDKNYKKEDVKEKKDIRLTSYSRSHVDLDEVRNKAYGVDNNTPAPEKTEDKSIEEELEDDNLLVDLSDKAKPEVKEITMGDALEYFQDLGLEYNVDYVDASKDKDTKVTKRSDLNKEEKEAVDKAKDYERPAILDAVAVDLKPVEEVAKTTNVVEIKDESKQTEESISEDDDNLFDLIDSMYQDKE